MIDTCPVKSARALPDKLVVKMPLETLQMLFLQHIDICHPEKNTVKKVCTKKRTLITPVLYGQNTHENYKWLLLHFITLCSNIILNMVSIMLHALQSFYWHSLKIFPMDIQVNSSFAQAMPSFSIKSNNHVNISQIHDFT